MTQIGLSMKEHIFNIHDVVLLMTAAECILLAIFQAVLPTKNSASSILLTSFLLSVAIGAGCLLVLWNDSVHTVEIFDQTFLPYFLSTAFLLKGPALYLYVKAITQHSFKLERKHLLHLIPIVICLVWLLVFQIDSGDLRFRP